LSFSESRLKPVAEIRFRVQSARAGDQHLFGLDIVRIGHAHIDRANRSARFVVMKSNAFGAQLWIDHVNRITLADCVIWAFRLARAAINAIAGNHRCHWEAPLKPLF
jgi:hypothetical protein